MTDSTPVTSIIVGLETTAAHEANTGPACVGRSACGSTSTEGVTVFPADAAFALKPIYSD